ncbi:MAG: diguanylate cyclase, partial [Halarsenatibacteraceae bacterium]
YKDSLTGLYNRRFFEEELKRLDTGRQLPISIVMIDVNGLKVINDTYGHKAGDKHLQKVADILKDSIRQEDILARWAGDEFVILMPNTDYEAAKMLYSRIKKNCLISYQNGNPVSVAVGFAVKKNSGVNITEVLEEADKNMYKDKTLEKENSGQHLIKFMMDELKGKSFETKEHVEKVRDLAVELADRIELNDEDKENLEFMARFHDIGLIMLPDELFHKEGRLDKEDWQELRKHPEHGRRIISSLREYNDVAENILSHHEWWNGQGYPEGLKGEEIPLYSRIIAIVDAYEVMTSGRPYKEARSIKEALKELKNYRGIQFDGSLVDEFVAMIKDDTDLEIDVNDRMNDDTNYADDTNNANDANDAGNTDAFYNQRFKTGVELDHGNDGRIKEDN